MNLASPGQVKTWCIENGFHPNKTLGQNFLVDGNVTKAIAAAGMALARAAAVETGGGSLRILEIGPGLGALTEALLAAGARVTAIEKDAVLAGRLAGALGNPPGLEVVAADALRIIEEGGADGRYDAMVSNLPYASGTRMLLELAGRRSVPAMTALVQTEVAERLAAREGSRARSLAGVLAQLDYDVEIVRNVSASCFWPRPQIGSSVVTLARHGRNDAMTGAERKTFRALAKRAFAHRRKQLGSIFGDLIQSRRRAEELSIEEWTTLAKGTTEK